MNDILKVLILASIGGLIGYFTNVVAIKLIFRPIEPITIPIINKEIIGLIPKRKSELAKNIGEVVQQEFLSLDEILDNIVTDEDKESVVKYIKVRIKMIVNEKISFAPSALKNVIQGYVSDAIETEIRQSIDDLTQEMVSKAGQRINIAQIVENKINELDLYKIEEIILRIAKQELRHIEVLGFILGFVIGIVQGIIVVII